MIKYINCTYKKPFYSLSEKCMIIINNNNNHTFTKQVISKGTQVFNGAVDCHCTQSVTVQLPVMPEFAPKAHILVFAVYGNEIVADEIDIDVKGNPSLQDVCRT